MSDQLSDTELRSAQAREHRRSQILAAAKEVIADRGYHKASINEIIRRADIARGTFYLYFESKEKVFASILEEALRALRARILRIEVADPRAAPPKQQLRDSLVRVFDYVLGERPLTQILLLHGQAADVEAAARVDGFYREIKELIRSSLDHGLEMGLVRPCNSRLVAAALLGAVRGVVQDAIDASEPPSTEAIVDELISFALRGVFQG